MAYMTDMGIIWPRVAIFNVLIGILKRPTLVAMVTKLWEFWHKISHNLVCIGAVTNNPASSKGFQGRTIQASLDF